MTLVLVAQCLSLELPQTQKLILQSLANYVDASGIAFPGKDIIATEASVSERRLRPHIKALEETGWIRILSVGNGRGQTTRYQLNTERIEAEYRQVLERRKAARAEKGDVATPFIPWKKGDVAVEKGDAVVQKGDVAVEKGDVHVRLSVLPVNNRSNHGGKRKGSPQSPTPITEDQLQSLLAKFPELDVLEEIEMARAHKAHQKWTKEYPGLLNWLKRAQFFYSQRKESGAKGAPAGTSAKSYSAPASHNGGQPVPQSSPTYEEERREKMRLFAQRQAEGKV